MVSGRSRTKPRQQHVLRNNAQRNEPNRRKRLARYRRHAARTSYKTTLFAEVNKLIFVQDFETAGRQLAQLASLYWNDAEIHFRRIEVACRTEALGEVVEEYKRLKALNPDHLIIEAAYLLSQIRHEELISEDSSFLKDDEFETPRPAAPSRDVVALDAVSEGSSKKRTPHQDEATKQLVARWESSRPPAALPATRSWRVERSPLVPDDSVPAAIPTLPDASADAELLSDRNRITEIRQNDASKHGEQLQHPLLTAALRLRDLQPKSAWAWFVLGCALELTGHLQEAVDAWTRAYQLNPESLAILATMAELQQIGALPDSSPDYADKFEKLDKYLVHGTYETHIQLYRYFLEKRESNHAIAALRTLADWMQRQRGEVPPEIEILCLLGAMNAYKLDSNSAAADACRREAENIAIACKKSPKSPAQIAFIGQIAEEYGLPNLARLCFYSVLIAKDTPLDLASKTAAHCVAHYASLSLKECLKTTYLNHSGNSEIRFCQLLCELTLSSVAIRPYMERKNRIRDALSKNQAAVALQLMQEALQDTNDDAEIHFYMSEMLSRLGITDRAKHHFSMMYELDSLNVDSVLRYLNFLIKNKEFFSAQEIARKTNEIQGLSTQQRSELHWVRASALLAVGEVDEAKQEIDRSLKTNPWSTQYLIVALRLSVPAAVKTNDPAFGETIISVLESQIGSNSTNSLNDDLLLTIIEHGRKALQAGLSEYAYALGKILFMLNDKSENVVEFFSKVGASYDPRLAAQQTLMLLQANSGEWSFSRLAVCIARIYSQALEWPLVDEWLDIAIKAGIDDKQVRSKLFELEALKLALHGTNFRKAQSLLEAALDIYDGNQKIPADTAVLHGYLILAQGNIKAGIEKMQTCMGENSSIQSLYFLIKGLERAGRLSGHECENILSLYNLAPTNLLEQKLIEEIYCTVGTYKAGASVNLAC
jgi:tetratricopeptide (TPR) repeat protein